MLEQRPLPTGPAWFAEPLEIWLPVIDIHPGTFSDEKRVTIKLNGSTTQAMVLAEDLRKDEQFVLGRAVSQYNNEVIVIIRPASMGRSVVTIPASKIQEFLTYL